MDNIPFEWPFVVPFECLVIPLVPFVCSRRHNYDRRENQ